MPVKWESLHAAVIGIAVTPEKSRAESRSVGESPMSQTTAASSTSSTPEKAKATGSGSGSSTGSGSISPGGCASEGAAPCTPEAKPKTVDVSDAFLPAADPESLLSAHALPEVQPASHSLGRALLACPEEGVTTGRIYWEAFFVVLPVFCGYAALFGLQHEIKSRFGIKDDNSAASHNFGFATSFLYIFNLIFRFAHNIVFGAFLPRYRVYIAMTAMMMSMLVIAVPIMILEMYEIHWVIIAYALGGVAIGCFEANLLGTLTPFGHQTKRIAITAIPVGITIVLVGGFFLMAAPLLVPVTAIYVGVACAVFMGMGVMAMRIPIVAKAPEDVVQPSTPVGREQSGLQRQQSGLFKLVSDAKEFRLWLPQIWHLPVAFAISMFSLSAFSPGLNLFIYDQKTVSFGAGFVIQTDHFFVIFNLINMLGGLTGRWCSYRVKAPHPLVFIASNVFGVLLVLQKMPALALVGVFFIMVGDGLIYGSISKRIDVTVPKEFNLIAISYWLFVGDFGSVLGSNLVAYIRDWVCG